MEIIHILLLALALSLDAMTVSAINGACCPEISKKDSLLSATTFGFFHLVALLLGWALGAGIQNIINGLDHWIAFILLGAVGLKMIIDALSPLKTNSIDTRNWKVLFPLAIATCIDALVIGITLPMLFPYPWIAIIIIGLMVALLSYTSFFIGKKFVRLIGKKTGLIGGLILIIIGIKTLIGHIFF